MCKNDVYEFGVTKRDCYFDSVLCFPSFWIIALCDAKYHINKTNLVQR